jgi:uncharacterized protein
LEKLKSKSLVKAVIVLALAAGLAAIIVFHVGGTAPKSSISTSACGPYRTDKTVQIDGQQIKAEIARNSVEFETGLGGRPCILPDQAMLFIFRAPDRYPFWMKGMKFPIDIVWITANFKVAAIEVDEQPSTYPASKFVNQIPAQYVLELKANRSKELHMAIGTPVGF